MSKQSEAKKMQKYNPSPTPPKCANCKNFTSDIKLSCVGFGGNVYHQEKNLRCGIGGFAIKKTAVCDNHEFKIG